MSSAGPVTCSPTRAVRACASGSRRACAGIAMPDRMQPLFSPAGEAAIAATLADSPLVAFDFDGTLAPIVAHPDDAQVLPALAPRLERLAGLLPLAIVSGRSVEDVRKRLTFMPRFVVGNHGAEDESMGVASVPA